jgi:hypothetical protein
LDYIHIEKTTMADKTKKAYGKSFPDDEIRSIMGRAIPPEWKVNLLALDKEPWMLKDLEDLAEHELSAVASISAMSLWDQVNVRVLAQKASNLQMASITIAPVVV